MAHALFNEDVTQLEKLYIMVATADGRRVGVPEIIIVVGF